MRTNVQLPTVRQATTLLRGGLDLITPTQSLPAGYATYSINFECSSKGGYSRIQGYERVDGRTAPSSARATIVQMLSIVSTPALGSTLTGDTSGATGLVARIVGNLIVLTGVVGTFNDSEVVKVGIVTIGTTTTPNYTLTAQDQAENLNACADVYRNLITAVGGAAGTGPVLGVFNYNGQLYAWRALSATPTQQGLWRATTGGWTQITLPSEVGFNTAVGTGLGNAIPPAEGATLTQGGVTATVRRVMLATGAWRTAATTADAGRFIITNVSGGNFVAGAATLSGGATVQITGAQTPVTFLVTGPTGAQAKHETDIGNFFGQRGTLRVYGVDGANRAYEFDGTYVCPISTGNTTDIPRHVAVHKNYLFLSQDSSLFFSEVGQPYRWVTGGEIATGDTVTGLLPQVGSQQTGALTVFCDRNIFVLYGTSALVFNLVAFNVGAGAREYTYQNSGLTYFFNAEGVTSLRATLDYGNFTSSSMTEQILPFIELERKLTTCSTLNRPKNQYRVFFSDGYGLYITSVNGKLLGVMPVFFPNTPNVSWSGGLADGDYVSYFGATNGFVYQLDKGTSFDGNNIDAAITLNWDNMRSPRMLKAYKQASIELRSPTFAQFQFSYQLGYGSPNIDLSVGYSLSGSTALPATWDSFTWDLFTWDGQSLLPVDVDLTGTGENVQISISSTTDYIDAYTLNSITYNYIPRRIVR